MTLSLTVSLGNLLILKLQSSDPRDLWHLRLLIRVIRKLDLTNILTIFDNLDHFHNSDNCFCHFDNWKNNPGDLWDTDYNSDNWEPEFKTIFVSWQFRVTLDSIRNSGNVCIIFALYLYCIWIECALNLHCICKCNGLQKPLGATASTAQKPHHIFAQIDTMVSSCNWNLLSYWINITDQYYWS